MENETKTFKITFVESTSVNGNHSANLHQVQPFHRVQLKNNSRDLFSELYDCCAHLFRSKVLHVDDYVFVLRYLDEDGDICAITSNTELLEALRQYPKILKVMVSTVQAFEPQSPELSDSIDSVKPSASLIKSNDSLKAAEGSCDDDDSPKNNTQLSGDDNDFVKLNHGDLISPPSIPIRDLSAFDEIAKIEDLENTDVERDDTELKDFRSNPPTINSPPVPVRFDNIHFGVPPSTPKRESLPSNSSASNHMDFDSSLFDAKKIYHPVELNEPLREPAPNNISPQPLTPKNISDATLPQQSLDHSSSTRRRHYFHCRKCSTKIEGVLHRCMICPHYNLCEACEAKANHPKSHPMIKARDVAFANLSHAKSTARSYIKSKSKLNASVLSPDDSDCLTVNIGESVTKLWTIINSGEVAWPVGTQLRLNGGTIALASDADNQQIAIDIPSLKPGERVRLSVLILVPSEVGTYKGSFRFYTPEDVEFGEDCPVEVTVRAPQSAPVEIPKPSPKVEKPLPYRALTGSPSQYSNPNDVSSNVVSAKPMPTVSTPIPRVYPIISAPPSSLMNVPPSSQIPLVPVSDESNMFPHELAKLVQMGFDPDVSRYMIIQTKGDANAAANAILRN